MGLQIFWFIAIAVLWTGFFVLEGFDFGVGALPAVVGKDDAERRVAINTIGPVWDGNEVWLIVGGAGIFAAFPAWYATLFSGLYLALLLLLVALIVRGVSFEFRGKRESPRWRNGWSLALTIGSLAAPFLIGVALADLLHGLPIDANQEFTGTFWDLLSPYAIFAGLTFVSLCLLHGATFLSLKTTGDIRDRAHGIARTQTIATGIAVLLFGIWTQVTIHHGAFPDLLSTAAVLAIFAAGWLLGERREGWAFADDRVRDGRHRADDLHRPVPARHGLQHRSVLQPHGDERVVLAVRAEGDDRGRADLPAGRDDLPGVELSRVPQADRDRGPRARRRTCGALRPCARSIPGCWRERAARARPSCSTSRSGSSRRS